MGRTPLNVLAKQGRQVSTSTSGKLSDVDRQVYNLIKSKQDVGIVVFDLKRELKLQDAIVKRSLKTLETQKLIKGVVNVHHKLNKHYMAVEFEPSKDITGGSWYSEGKLDSDFIKLLRDICMKCIDKLEVVTVDGLFDYLRGLGIIKGEFSSHQVLEILQALVFDNEIEEVKSTGEGVFSSIPMGRPCYRRIVRRLPTKSILTSVPCGVCPHINECTPDGVISPTNCIYFTKWLDF